MARLVFSGVLERHPTLKVLIHHGGSMVPFFAGRVGPGWDQLGARTPADRHEEVAGTRALQAARSTTSACSTPTRRCSGPSHALRCSLDFFGVDHMLFASDSPFDPEKGPAYIRATIADVDALDSPTPSGRRSTRATRGR